MKYRFYLTLVAYLSIGLVYSCYAVKDDIKTKPNKYKTYSQLNAGMSYILFTIAWPLHVVVKSVETIGSCFIGEQE